MLGGHVGHCLKIQPDRGQGVGEIAERLRTEGIFAEFLLGLLALRNVTYEAGKDRLFSHSNRCDRQLNGKFRPVRAQSC